MAGNGVIRAGAEAIVRFAEKLQHPRGQHLHGQGRGALFAFAVAGGGGHAAHDYVACGFDRADVIICVGYDMVEYPPSLWHPSKDRQIVHVESPPPKWTSTTSPACERAGRHRRVAGRRSPPCQAAGALPGRSLWQAIMDELCEHADDECCPMKPQRIVWDLQRVLPAIATWSATWGRTRSGWPGCISRSGPTRASFPTDSRRWGSRVPGAVAAKLAFPDRPAVAVTGDAGFLMNSQEIETALRIGTPIVIVIWNDNGYGLIEWHQLRHFGRPATSASATRISSSMPRVSAPRATAWGPPTSYGPSCNRRIADNTVVVIDCPVDYAENMKLTEKLSKMVCPV